MSRKIPSFETVIQTWHILNVLTKSINDLDSTKPFQGNVQKNTQDDAQGIGLVDWGMQLKWKLLGHLHALPDLLVASHLQLCLDSPRESQHQACLCQCLVQVP